jgi:IclR family transcriptional regulator, acetate operon repressor
MSRELERLKFRKPKTQAQWTMSASSRRHPKRDHRQRTAPTAAVPAQEHHVSAAGSPGEYQYSKGNFVVAKAVDMRQSIYPLRAVDRVCDILDLLTRQPSGISLSTLAAAVALPKSSAFRYLAALEMRGYVVRSDDGIGYRLGSPIGGGHPVVNGRLERLITAAKPLMARLTSSDVPVSMLATLDGTGIRYLSVSAPPRIDPRVPRVGDRCMLHSNAAGKAIAAQFSDETVLRLIDAAGMPQTTSRTLGSPTGLLRELHRVRGEGFAMSENERYPDVRGVAVPIGGETLALSLAGREDQFTPDRVASAVRQLRRAAVVLAREIRD